MCDVCEVNLIADLCFFLFADINVGQTLQSGKASYTVLKFLGEGSFGKVVEALNTDTNETVALKMIKDPGAIREAEREVRLWLS